ncbi:hypothetical protein DFH06DRAFT_1130468 [Mycena polygramma]|nr:hypothetical protein DFH06DRAFT_1130468 [Mycena polygramma]
MSVFVEGCLPPTFSYLPNASTTISSAFRSTLPPGPNTFLLTPLPLHRQALSFALPCQVSPSETSYVVLGSDWAAYVRESLLNAGHRLPSFFDAWQFLLNPEYLLSGNASLLLNLIPFIHTLPALLSQQPIRHSRPFRPHALDPDFIATPPARLADDRSSSSAEGLKFPLIPHQKLTKAYHIESACPTAFFPAARGTAPSPVLEPTLTLSARYTL